MLKRGLPRCDTSAYMWHTIRKRSPLRTETSAIAWAPKRPNGMRLPEREVARLFSPDFLEKLGDLPRSMLVSDLMTIAGLCDGLEARRLIHAGAVSVNGEPCLSPVKSMSPELESISIAGRPLEDCVTVSFVVHKPVKFTSTPTDPFQRPSVLSLLPNPNWYYRPVDRIDYNSGGLVVLSNNHFCTQGLTQTWLVTVSGRPEQLDRDLRSAPFEDIERVSDLLLRVRSNEPNFSRSVYGWLGRPVNLARSSLGALSLDSLGLTRPGNILAINHLQLYPDSFLNPIQCTT